MVKKTYKKGCTHMKEPSFQDKQLGRTIRDIRLEKGMTLETFCDLFDAPKPAPSIISRWERGVSLPNPSRLKRLAEIGGIEPNELHKRGLDFFTGNLGNLANTYENALPNIQHDISQSYLYFRLGEDYLSLASKADNTALIEFEELLDLLHSALNADKKAECETLKSTISKQVTLLLDAL